jgi:putative cell wall-binding protein
VLIAGVLVALGSVSVASGATAPDTLLSLDPSSPTGTPPWYVAAPQVRATCDQDATLYYGWVGSAEQTMAVSAGVPVSLGFAPEGVATMEAYAVSFGVTETTPAQQTVRTDSIPPARPSGLGADTDGGDTVLEWSSTTDGGDPSDASGLFGYYVYRNQDGVLFQTSDRIGFTSQTSLPDPDEPGPTAWWYAISARDVAGNESFLTDAIRVARPERVAGSDRFDTSYGVSRTTFAPSSVTTAVIASGLDFPDALCASGLAGVLDSPVLLVGEGPIRPALVDELARLGVTDAYVVGGSVAVGADTFASIDAALSGTVRRVWGPTRYSTARRVADEVAEIAGGVPRAYVVSGVTFPDALSAAPAAYVEGSPILFATPDAVARDTLASLSELGVADTVILGGPAAVWIDAEGSLPSPVRVQGSDRYATSRAFADWARSDGVLDGGRLVIATGLAFPDGLSASSLAGAGKGPVVLSSSADVTRLAVWLQADPERFDEVYVIGGTRALEDAVRLAVGDSLSID